MSFDVFSGSTGMNMLLEGKNAIVYGGSGSVGGAVAHAFAEAGARVFLAGRTSASLEAVAESIRAAGGSASVAVVDALDPVAVSEFVDSVAAQGSVDISLNVISDNDVGALRDSGGDVADRSCPGRRGRWP
jgi:NAD(P)-dependent dehydrogenase (short-subunit alcohol dehydrogenase family)